MKIICIGRNYIEHTKELKNPVPEEPVFFLKPDTALLIRNRPFFHPFFSEDIHYEAEIVLRICKVGKNVQEKYAHTYYQEIGIGIDFTARDLQAKCKEKGLPWEVAKGFDFSAPLSDEFIPKKEFSDLSDINFHLDLNGETVQNGNTRDMIFTFDRLIAHVSQFMTLRIGDLFFTGTPAGVGKVKVGDRLEAYIEGRKLLAFDVK
ncbi:MAG: fumarylacetoacetate hydrolase family protein [Bacteroidota bacterium]|nr:fumarylacetoacetate hydrolase family protein [Bacteroidota bacterium]